GHPLADIGYNAYLWRSNSASWGTLQGVDFATSGIPTERAYVDAYLKRVGRGPVDDWNFYVAFSVFRLASIGQGVYRRILDGDARGPRLLLWRRRRRSHGRPQCVFEARRGASGRAASPDARRDGGTRVRQAGDRRGERCRRRLGHGARAVRRHSHLLG